VAKITVRIEGGEVKAVDGVPSIRTSKCMTTMWTVFPTGLCPKMKKGGFAKFWSGARPSDTSLTTIPDSFRSPADG